MSKVPDLSKQVDFRGYITPEAFRTLFNHTMQLAENEHFRMRHAMHPEDIGIFYAMGLETFMAAVAVMADANVLKGTHDGSK